MLSELVQKQPADDPPKLLIYGQGGIGKSSIAAGAPAPLFVPTEDRLGHIECDRVPLVKTHAAAMEVLQALAEDDHDYQTVVIDSADWLEEILKEHLCAEYGKKTFGEVAGGYGKEAQALVALWRESILTPLDWLRQEKGMGVIFTAHASTEKVKDPELGDYDRHAPALHKASAAMLCDWCSGVFHYRQKTHVIVEEDSFKNKRGKAKSTGERFIRTEARAYEVAKNSWGMPYEVPIPSNPVEAWDALAAAMYAEVVE